MNVAEQVHLLFQVTAEQFDGARRSHSSWNRCLFSSRDSSGGSTPRHSLSDALPWENSTGGETPVSQEAGRICCPPPPPPQAHPCHCVALLINKGLLLLMNFCQLWLCVQRTAVCVHHTNARGHSSAAVQQVVPLPVIWGKCVRPEVRAALCSQPGHLSAFVPVTSSAQAPTKREIVNSPERPSVEIRA